MVKNIAVIGSSGTIGSAFIDKLLALHPDATLHAFSRQVPQNSSHQIKYHKIDYQSEDSIAEAASIASQENLLDMVIVATGILHDGNITPEKALKDLSAEKLQHLFAANTILPALILKHFAPRLRKDYHAFFAILSARIGSISDNMIGGWYSYRASKAALNMIIRNAAIEVKRTNQNAVIVGLHPGTVDSQLSRPYQHNVPATQLFTPEFAVLKMLDVLKNLTPDESGLCFAWDGKEIKP